MELAGVGMKATTSGMTVGIALEPFDGSNSTTTATIGSSSTGSETNVVKTGKILVFVNLGYSKIDPLIPTLAAGETAAWSVDPVSGKLKSSLVAGLDLQAQDIVNVRSILSANGLWRIDENGKLVAKEIETEKLTVTGGASSGITIYDRVTLSPKCVYIANNALSVLDEACGAVLGASQPQSVPLPSPLLTPSPAPSPLPASSPSPTSLPEPPPVGGLSPSPEPSASPST